MLGTTSDNWILVTISPVDWTVYLDSVTSSHLAVISKYDMTLSAFFVVRRHGPTRVIATICLTFNSQELRISGNVAALAPGARRILYCCWSVSAFVGNSHSGRWMLAWRE